MAGYSGTPLAKKLGIAEGATVLATNAPEAFWSWLEPLPPGVEAVTASGPRSVDVLVYFATAAESVDADFDDLAETITWAGGLWLAWPKRASGVPTDITEDVLRDVALSRGLVDNKVCAIDETWSGLRVVHRLEDRPKPTSPRA